jgi:hypothetical protein
MLVTTPATIVYHVIDRVNGDLATHPSQAQSIKVPRRSDFLARTASALADLRPQLCFVHNPRRVIELSGSIRTRPQLTTRDLPAAISLLCHIRVHFARPSAFYRFGGRSIVIVETQCGRVPKSG